MYEDALEQVIIKVRQELSHLYVQCRCAWTKAGIRSSSTCPTSRGARMALTTSKRSACRSSATHSCGTASLSPRPFTLVGYSESSVALVLWQIHANCRIRRIYFSDRLYSEDELPSEFKLFLPVQQVCVLSASPSADKRPSERLCLFFQNK